MELQSGYGWKGLWRSTLPTPLLKQNHLEPFAQDHDQMAFEYVQGWMFYNLPGQPVLNHSHSEKVF